MTSRTVVVTAGARGIGRAISEAFLENGDDVYIIDICEKAIEEALSSCQGLSGEVCDVADAAQVEAFFKRLLEKAGSVDVLVNNAGIGGPRAALEDISYDDWERCVRVNLSGVFHCIKQVAGPMKKKGRGCILNISTGSTRTGLPMRAPYVASKCAVNGLTYNVARELGPHNISCNAILPGLIDNPRGRALAERHGKELGISTETAEADMLKYVSMRSWIKPEEVAAMAVFLASHEARHVTGQLIGVCGNAEWEE